MTFVLARNIRQKAPPQNSFEASIWADRNFIKLKNDLLEAQLDESRTKAERNRSQTELNRSQTLAATEKAKFWERANAALSSNDLLLVLQSDNNHHLHIQSQQQQVPQQLQQEQQLL